MLPLLFVLFPFFASAARADVPKVNAPAPLFEAVTDLGEPFKLADRKGTWTVLYFYPKDNTPGCTKQACAFRDSIKLIREKGAEVFGISKDSVESHRKFKEKHKLNFPLLADPDGDVVAAYGAGGFLGMAKRWTFIVGPDLTVRWVQTDVDPVSNAKVVAEELGKLQSGK